MKTIPVILAGGEGSRFWPLSRKKSPKQILNLSGNDTLIAEAVKRFEVYGANVHIVTAAEQAKHIQGALPDNADIQYILEPVQRGTAACILMAVFKIYKEYGECVICMSPSDHYITNNDEFTNVMDSAIECAAGHDKIVTIGITPSFPATGYGYICCDYDLSYGKAYEVKEFVEKPSFNKATGFLNSGNYFWNSGIFVFKASVILESFKRFLPRIYNSLAEWDDFSGSTEQTETLFNKIYGSLQNISIDYGIIERSSEVCVIPANMGWNDIGSWDSLGCLFPPDEFGNIVRAKTINLDTKNCVMYSDKSLVATIGIENLIIVDCDDALMICDKSEAQRVKELVGILKEKDLHEYL